MSPSPPEHDATPKAPDKTKHRSSKPAVQVQPQQQQRDLSSAASAGEDKQEPSATTNASSVLNLNDRQLKALLDEAISYKIPKDREGKSELFKTMLIDAEDEERKAHARNASGPETVRYFNSAAAAKGRHQRTKRQTSSSVSENVTHGGSLNDLAKEELYESHPRHRPKKTVSARQREGGSLPCNVNGSSSGVGGGGGALDRFPVEVATTVADKEITASPLPETVTEGGTNDMETRDCMMKNDALTANYALTFTTQTTLQIGNVVDEAITFPGLEHRKEFPPDDPPYKNVSDMGYHQQYSLMSPMNNMKIMYNTTKNQFENEKKALDENGNALAHLAQTATSNSMADSKRRKKANKKSEGSIDAKDVKGHRADIINNIDMLVEFISGTPSDSKGSLKSSKLHKQHVPQDDKAKHHKQRTRSSKGTKSSSGNPHVTHMQKSNSMEEISTTKLEDFQFEQEQSTSTESNEKLAATSKVTLRPTKSNAERPRERKSWLSEQPYSFYQNVSSAENLEGAISGSSDFTFVTKKKKSKKRRNSLGSRKQPSSEDADADEDVLRIVNSAPSTGAPRLPRRKSACSAPHSDSSDADSISNETLISGLQVSYADIAKSAERKQSPQKALVPAAVVTVSPTSVPSAEENNTTVIVSAKVNLDQWPTIQNNNHNSNNNNNNNSCNNSTHNSEKVSNVNSNNNNNRSPAKIVQNHTAPVVTSATTLPSVRENNIMNGPQQIIQKVVEHQQQLQQQTKNMLQNHQQFPRLQHPQHHHHQHHHYQQQQQQQHQYHHQHQLQQQQQHHHLHQQQHQQQHHPHHHHQQQAFPFQMPANIRDVQSIEMMHFKNIQKTAPPVPTATVTVTTQTQPIPQLQQQQQPQHHHQEERRPAVVILSGRHDRPEDSSSDLTFGFDINEQLLLSDDGCGGSDDVCFDFSSRFFQPEVPPLVQVDQMIQYIGTEWEDVLAQTHSGKVKYFIDNL